MSQDQDQNVTQAPPDDTEDQSVDSTSDERVVNNLMRHQYRVLSEIEKKQMQRVKDLGLGFVKNLHGIGGTPEMIEGNPAGQGSRELSIAQTHIEDAVMWAVKHITR